MMTNDLINGGFELFGGVLCWINVRRLYRDKEIKGVSWQVQAFFAAWSVWNLWFYPSLGQTASFLGAIFLVLGNGTWVLMAWHYGRKNRRKILTTFDQKELEGEPWLCAICGEVLTEVSWRRCNQCEDYVCNRGSCWPWAKTALAGYLCSACAAVDMEALFRDEH